MTKTGRMAIVALIVSVCASAVAAQQKPEKPTNPAHLELTMEVAATTEEGYPSVLRVITKNVGNVAVDMPMPVLGCIPHGGYIVVHIKWKSSDTKNQIGGGWDFGCGKSDSPGLMERVHDKWIHLRPGEIVISSQNLHEILTKIDPGTVEYWFQYVPPEAGAKDLAELQQAGYIIPTEKIETAHQSFVVY
jgi:hypothetical protein